MNKTKILISGFMGLFPVGRHMISFLSCLLQDERNEVYLNSEFMTDDAQKVLDKFFKNYLLEKKIKFDKDLPADFEYDFNIFPSPIQPITERQDHLYKFLKKKAKFKVCYPVFDGSVPLLEWIDIINKNFDICLSPSEYCAHNLKRYGVTIDCMNLECLVLIDEMLNMNYSQKKNKKFRFGCISAHETRKNLPFLIEAFSRAFSKDDPVELVINAIQRPDIMCTEELLDNTYKKCSEVSNIILEKGFKEHEAILDLWSSFDAYICPQSVTGYFTTPAEAMAVGIPCILSDIPVHKELTKYVTEENNFFFVKHDIIKTFFHGVFCYRNLGAKFDSSIENYIKILKEVYSKKDYLYEEEYIKERKNGIKALTTTELQKKYNTVFNPSKVCISDKQGIKDGVLLLSKTLAQKYLEEKRIKEISTDKILLNEKNYVEEANERFKAIEETSIDSQKIYIACIKEALKNVNPECQIDPQKTKLTRFLSRVKNYRAYKFLNFLFIQLKIYCAIKKPFIKRQKKKNVVF